MAIPDFSTFRPLDLSTLLPPFVLSSFCHFVFLSFCPFVLLSFCRSTLSSFRPFVILSFRPSLSTCRLRRWFLIPLFMIFAGFGAANAQVMHLEIRVDSEFGLGDLIRPELAVQAAPGDGLVETSYDGESAGQLTLHTTENVDLLVTLAAPEHLVLDEENLLALELRMAYAHPIIAGPPDINPVADPTTTIRMNPGNLLINDMLSPPLKFETYLFFYGSVNIGDVAPGTYAGTVRLRVEYP